MSKQRATDAKLLRRIDIERALKTLIGIVEGIAIDGRITVEETRYLSKWIKDNRRVYHRHPFNELMPVVMDALDENRLSDDKRKDILWLCEQLSREGYFDQATTDLQRLHGLLGGIVADGVVTERELEGLSQWMDAHDHLRECWPYDEVDAIVNAVMADGKIDRLEQAALQTFFTELTSSKSAAAGALAMPMSEEAATSLIFGVYSDKPRVSLGGALFCVVGTFHAGARADVERTIESLGGRCTDAVSQEVDYVVVGGNGNPCWTYTCHGRTIEAAAALRARGHRVQLVREEDFQRAVDQVRGRA